MRKMKRNIALLFLAAAFALESHAQEPLPTDSIIQKVATGQPFTLVFLKSGDVKAADDSTLGILQMQHLRNLFTMEKEGKISVFGPITSDETYKGIIVFNSIDKNEVSTELNKDPYIKAGFLTYELFDFFCIPGQRIP